MTKRRLGRGLDALIPLTEDEPSDTNSRPHQGVLEVDIAAISPNPHQPRSSFGEEEMQELAQSIAEHGVIQPLIVSKIDTGYQLIAGERRWRAAQLADLATVPVLVKDVAPVEALELALVENVQRSDLNALEEAIAYQQLMEGFHLTQEQVAQRVGKSRVTITNTLRLLKAARVVQQALLENQISEGHARALLGLDHSEAQEAALRSVLKRGLNVRQTEGLVRKLLGTQEKKSVRRPDPQTRALETALRESFSTRVDVKKRGDSGRVVIYFYSEEELDVLYQRLRPEE